MCAEGHCARVKAGGNAFLLLDKSSAAETDEHVTATLAAGADAWASHDTTVRLRQIGGAPAACNTTPVNIVGAVTIGSDGNDRECADEGQMTLVGALFGCQQFTGSCWPSALTGVENDPVELMPPGLISVFPLQPCISYFVRSEVGAFDDPATNLRLYHFSRQNPQIV